MSPPSRPDEAMPADGSPPPAELGAGAPSPQHIKAWARELAVPVEALESAIKAVGTDPARVKDFLTGGGAAKQQDG